MNTFEDELKRTLLEKFSTVNSQLIEDRAKNLAESHMPSSAYYDKHMQTIKDNPNLVRWMAEQDRARASAKYEAADSRLSQFETGLSDTISAASTALDRAQKREYFDWYRRMVEQGVDPNTGMRAGGSGGYGGGGGGYSGGGGGEQSDALFALQSAFNQGLITEDEYRRQARLFIGLEDKTPPPAQQASWSGGGLIPGAIAAFGKYALLPSAAKLGLAGASSKMGTPGLILGALTAADVGVDLLNKDKPAPSIAAYNWIKSKLGR